MKKIYTKACFTIFPLLLLCFITNTGAYSQICGGVSEDFNNTSGSTNGFTGDLSLRTAGTDSYLSKDRVLESGVYAITSPTYKLPADASSIGFGFTLGGTQRIERIDVKVIYFSTASGETVTVFLGQFIPTYSPGSTTTEFCQSAPLSRLAGFPTAGQYRLRVEVSPLTGSGVAGEIITFDNFRTNGPRSQAPLPVTFIGLDAKKMGGSVLLTWQIAGEENVARYEVERSEDGRQFSTIASIERHGKDTYTYSDMNQLATAYYRIRNVDNDGKFKHSAIARIINGRGSIVLKAFPQPVTGQLTIQHPPVSGRPSISISTADGRVWKTVVPSAGSIQTPLDMSALQKGLYVIRFDTGNGEVETMKVLKQ